MNLTEKETREKVIDPVLIEDAGWREEYIRREVNSVRSKFEIGEYILSGGKDDNSGRFIDYLLLDEHKKPLAIIEAKRFSLDAEKGSIQATTYQKDVESQTKIPIPIFLTNGQKWFFKEKGYPTREISGPFSQKDLQRRAKLFGERQKLSNIGVNPKIDDKVLDPACGTSGFLVSAYQYILKANKKEDVSRLTPKQKKILDEESIFGFDIDETMTRIALMNLMMHGIKRPNIKRGNTLSDSEPRISDNTYDVILANPPFKGSLNVAEISERFRIKTTKTEILFLELIYHALSPSGRCAVIVPEGILFGNSNAHKRIREILLTDCRLDAVISMPSGVFKPYAGVSTAVLFFTKGEPTQKVWFYKMESDGFSLDDKRTFIDGKGDIPEILDKFDRRDKENPTDRKKKYFFVPVEEIKEKNWDLSISKYREIEYEEVKYEKPDVLKKKILTLEKEIIEGLNKLKI